MQFGFKYLYEGVKFHRMEEPRRWRKVGAMGKTKREKGGQRGAVWWSDFGLLFASCVFKLNLVTNSYIQGRKKKCMKRERVEES